MSQESVRDRAREERQATRAALREKMIRELRAGFLETDRALALLAASNVVETIEELVGIEIALALADRDEREKHAAWEREERS